MCHHCSGQSSCEFTTLRELDKLGLHNTGCLQMNGAVLKINKKFISHLTWAKHTSLAAATVPSSSCTTRSSLARAYCGASFQDGVTAWKRLSVCSALRCPDL